MEGTISYKQSKFNSSNLYIRMDQAASVMSDPSSALYIKFYPTLNASAVRLPTRAVFVIANSLVVADKALSAKRGYNLRVVETLVGARILAQAVGLSLSPEDRITYREVVGRFAGEQPGADMGADALEAAITRLEAHLDVLKPRMADGAELGVTMEEMVQMSGLAPDAFHEVYLSWVDSESPRPLHRARRD